LPFTDLSKNAYWSWYGRHPETLQKRYRAHLCFPFETMVIALAISGMMDLQSNLELIKRTAIAIKDHNAYAALPI
jgi:hypothetical protein